jgi:hypothetical protein
MIGLKHEALRAGGDGCRSSTLDHQMIGLKHEALRAGGDGCRSSTLDLQRPIHNARPQMLKHKALRADD